MRKKFYFPVILNKNVIFFIKSKYFSTDLPIIFAIFKSSHACMDPDIICTKNADPDLRCCSFMRLIRIPGFFLCKKPGRL